MGHHDFEVDSSGDVLDVRRTFQSRLHYIRELAIKKNEEVHKRIVLVLTTVMLMGMAVLALEIFSVKGGVGEFSIIIILVALTSAFILRFFTSHLRRLILRPYVETLLDKELKEHIGPDIDRRVVHKYARKNIIEDIEQYLGDYIDDFDIPDF